MGIDIIMRLRQNQLTSRWLIAQLSVCGFTVSPPELSRYLNGDFKNDKAVKLITVSKCILDDYELSVGNFTSRAKKEYCIGR